MANIGYGQDYTGVQSPFTVKVDKSLTKTGWAADSSATGTAVGDAVTLVSGFDERITEAQTNASNAVSAANEAVSAATAAEQAVATKQDLLVNQENIKSISGNSILGSGDLSVRTYQVFNDGWNTTGTTTEFCDSIINDEAATAGMAYLGVLYCSDLPGMIQGECVVEIISDTDTNGKNIHLILTSAETYPYKWELHYVKINGLYTSTGWLGYQTEITPNPTLVGFESSLFGLQVGNTKYKVVTQEYIGENYLPNTIAIKWGAGTNSIIEGDLTRNIAVGDYSHAEGLNTYTQSDASHTEGCGTKASSNYQHVQGKFNVEDSADTYADLVGWGTADNARKNISALGTDGTLHLSGDVYVGANDDSSGGTKLQPVQTNPTLAGTEEDLTGLQVGDTKYKVGKQLYQHNVSIYQNDTTDGVLRASISLITSSNAALNTYNKLKSAIAPLAGNTGGNVMMTGSLEGDKLFIIHCCTVYNDTLRMSMSAVDGGSTYPYTNITNATYTDVVVTL